MNNSIFNQIISKSNILTVISSYLDVINKGRNHWAICPFHQDTKPSLSISEEKQIFKCFSCGVGGNSIVFVREIDNIDFLAAAKKVADICNIDVDIKLSKNDKTKKWSDEQTKILDFNDEVANFFSLYLKTQEGKEALNYLKKRNIDDEIIDKFSIGLAPNENKLEKFAKVKQIDQNILIASGLFNVGEKSLRDFFVDRIIFPIKDEYGKVLAFSGRTYKSTPYAKYKNSPETSVFTKGDVLYNFDLAKSHIAKTKNLIVCEGFMDVIGLYKSGFLNVIATMGTSFTPSHIQKIKAYTKSVILFMDGDKAGQLATMKMASTLIQSSLNVKVVKAIAQRDVFDIYSENGADVVVNLVKQAKDFYQFILEEELNKISKTDTGTLAKFIKFIKPIVLAEKDKTKLQIFVNAIKEKFGIELKTQVDKEKENTTKFNTYSESSQKYWLEKYGGVERAEKEVLIRMMTSSDAVKQYVTNIGYLPSKVRSTLADFIVYHYHKNKTFNKAIFINSIQDKANLLSEFNDITWVDLVKYDSKEFQDLIKKVKTHISKDEIKKLKTKLEQTDDQMQKVKIIKEIQQVKERARQS